MQDVAVSIDMLLVCFFSIREHLPLQRHPYNNYNDSNKNMLDHN